jgi:hypothetical protein
MLDTRAAALKEHELVLWMEMMKVNRLAYRLVSLSE